ncbi:MAG TPA: hypothetical protein VFZ73_19875, partial [Gemmatimonadaceae bacterium]
MTSPTVLKACCLTALLGTLMACGGGDQRPAGDTATAAPSPAATAPAGFDPTTITPAMIALGDSVF